MTRKRKISWPPCVICGQPDGPIHPHGVTPIRECVLRFGVDGTACRACYERLRLRAIRGMLKADPRELDLRRRQAKTSWSPCVVCGQADGYILPGRRTPYRGSVARYGVEGLACRTCLVRLQSRERRLRRSIHTREADRCSSSS